MLFSYMNSDVPVRNAVPYLTFFIIFISTIFITKKLLVRFSFDNIILILSTIYLIQACTVLLFFFNAPFKIWVLNNFIDLTNIDYEVSIRSKGISGSGASISLYMSLGLFYLLYLIGCSKNKLVIAYSFFGIALLIIGVFLTGRTGFVFSFILIASFVSYYLIESGVLRIRKDFLLYSFLFLVVLPLGFYLFKSIYEIIFSTGNNTKYGVDQLSAITDWVFKESSGESSTIKILIDHHLVINSDFVGFIFGNPDFLYDDSHSTDIGYLRTLNDFGIIGFALYYSSLFVLFMTPVLCNKGFARFMLVGLMSCLFIAEVKEPFLFKHLIVTSYLFIVFLFGLERQMTWNNHDESLSANDDSSKRTIMF